MNRAVIQELVIQELVAIAASLANLAARLAEKSAVNEAELDDIKACLDILQRITGAAWARLGEPLTVTKATDT